MVKSSLLLFAKKLERAGHSSLAVKIADGIWHGDFMEKQVVDYSKLISGNGIVSDELLEGHFKLYKGYVDAFNKIRKKLDSVKKEGNYSYSEFSELKRRLSVAYNGAYLHEQYFTFLNPEGFKKQSKTVKEMIESKWGSVEDYLEDVKQTALAAGNGWVVTLYHPEFGLDNALVTEHHIGHLSGATPIMVLDTWEHAFAYDYKIDRESYVTKFLENLSFELMETYLPSTAKEEQ